MANANHIKVDGVRYDIEDTQARTDVEDLKSALYPLSNVFELQWTKKNITDQGAMTTSQYRALTDIVKCEPGDVLLDLTPAKDANNVGIGSFLATYKTVSEENDTFIERISLTKNKVYTLGAEVTGFRICFGRNASTGVVLSDSDISNYFNILYFCKTISKPQLDNAVDSIENEIANITELSGNLINVNTAFSEKSTTALQQTKTGIICTGGTSTYDRAAIILRVTPNHNYVFGVAIKESLPYSAWVGMQESDTEDGFSGNSHIVCAQTSMRDEYRIVDIVPTKQYIKLLFYVNGSTALGSAHSVEFDRILLEEAATCKGYRQYIRVITYDVNAGVESEINLFSPYRLMSSNKPVEVYQIQDGIRIISPSTAYSYNFIDLELEVNKEYELSLVEKNNSGVRPWVGYVERDEDAEYPSKVKVLVRNTDPENTALSVTIIPTKQYQQIRFYGNAAPGGETDNEFVNIKLIKKTENPHEQITGIDSNKSEAAILKQVKNDTIYPSIAEMKLLFFTDVHKEIAQTRNVRNLAEEWGSGYIDAVVCGGDIVRQAIGEDSSERETNAGFYHGIFADFEIPLLNVIGNHDSWEKQAIYSPTRQYFWAEQTDIYNLFIEPYAEAASIVQPSNAEENGLCYYYKDFGSAIRLIVIDCNEPHWNAAQIAWLEDALDDARESGLHVVCCSHSPFNSTYQTLVPCRWTYRAGATYTPGAYEQTPIEAAAAVKAFIDAGGTFVCWLVGHTHFDCVWTLGQDYGGQMVVSMASITNMQAWLYKSTDPSQYSFDCMTYIVCDTTSKVIKFMRIGANIDVYGVKRDGLSIDYDNNTVVDSW